MSKKNSYDYVIIGGGSAGSVLGNRLTEDKDKEVLVLEAGRSDYPWDLFIQMPAALMFYQVIVLRLDLSNGRRTAYGT